MEKLQKLKFCPWISEKCNLKEYFDQYMNLLEETNRQQQIEANGQVSFYII